jgi:predicted transcriptional regulator
MVVVDVTKPLYTTYSIRIDNATDDALERLAAEDLCPKSVVIRQALRDFIKARKEAADGR